MDGPISCKKEEIIWNKKFESGMLDNLNGYRKKEYEKDMVTLISRFSSLEFSDDEIISMLTERKNALGKIPSQKEIFPVYRYFIRKRFRNWPTALRAAGLKAPKEKKSYEKKDL